VLTVLALIGVVGLTATLLGGGRSAPKPVRAPATRATLQRVLSTVPLRRALQQQLQLQGLLSNRRPGRPHVPTIAVPFGGAVTCPVAAAGCSTNPCVFFAQGASQPVVVQSVQGIVATPAPGPASRRCTRHALPRTFRVSAPVAPQLALPAQAQSVSVSAPRPSSRHGS
jgi:hypothetical protein